MYASALPAQEQEKYLVLIERFPEATFFANTAEQVTQLAQQQKIKLPKWFQLYRTTLAEAFKSETELLIQFDRFSTELDVGTPSRFELSETWYELSFPGLLRKGLERQALLKGSPTHKIFPIGMTEGGPDLQLGINLSDGDTTIYEFSLSSVFAAFSTGEDTATVLFPVFTSPGDLLSHIISVRHDGVRSEKV